MYLATTTSQWRKLCLRQSVAQEGILIEEGENGKFKLFGDHWCWLLHLPVVPIGSWVLRVRDSIAIIREFVSIEDQQVWK